jgi:hydrocephalus-inducing protein
LHNDGDIGASFKWNLDEMKPDFSIHPSYGYISPGMEVTFNVTFNPHEISSDIRKANVKCFIEGIEPVTLTLTGSCIQVMPQRETHHFETSVRQKDSKFLSQDRMPQAKNIFRVL